MGTKHTLQQRAYHMFYWLQSKTSFNPNFSGEGTQKAPGKTSMGARAPTDTVPTTPRRVQPHSLIIWFWVSKSEDGVPIPLQYPSPLFNLLPNTMKWCKNEIRVHVIKWKSVPAVINRHFKKPRFISDHSALQANCQTYPLCLISKGFHVLILTILDLTHQSGT